LKFVFKAEYFFRKKRIFTMCFYVLIVVLKHFTTLLAVFLRRLKRLETLKNGKKTLWWYPKNFFETFINAFPKIEMAMVNGKNCADYCTIIEILYLMCRFARKPPVRKNQLSNIDFSCRFSEAISKLIVC
jgi:uncharacterized membrane protein